MGAVVKNIICLVVLTLITFFVGCGNKPIDRTVIIIPSAQSLGGDTLSVSIYDSGSGERLFDKVQTTLDSVEVELDQGEYDIHSLLITETILKCSFLYKVELGAGSHEIDIKLSTEGC